MSKRRRPEDQVPSPEDGNLGQRPAPYVPQRSEIALSRAMAHLSLAPVVARTADKAPPEEQVRTFLAQSAPLSLLIREFDEMHVRLTNTIDREREQKLGMSWRKQCEEARESGKRICVGDRVIADYWTAIRKMKLLPYGPQMEIFRGILSSNIAAIYGVDYDAEKDRIVKQLGIKDHRAQLLVSMPRRNGKTVSVAAGEAAMQWARMRNGLPGGQTAVFAHVLPQACAVVQLIRQHLVALHDGDSSVLVVDNPRELRYSPVKRNKTDLSAGIIKAYSGSSNSARGFKADRIIFDEASFARPDFVKRNVFAGMLLKDVSVVMISSPPTDMNNIFARIFNATWDNGTRIFKVIEISNCCEDCKQLGLGTCPHKKQPRAEWLVGNDGMELIRHVLGRIDPLALKQEIDGVLSNDDLRVFPPDVLARWRARPRVQFHDKPDYLYVTVDPSGSGRCETAVCAVAPYPGDRGGFVVRTFVCSLFLLGGS